MMKRILLGLLGLGVLVVILKWGRTENCMKTISAQITDIIMGGWESVAS